MKQLTIIILLALQWHASAQSGIRMPDPLESLSPAQKNTLDQQAQDFFNAAKPTVAQAAQSTITLSYRNQQVAYGTAVTSPHFKKNVILTKWSEIAHYYKRLYAISPSGKHNLTSLLGVYPDYDLAVLDTPLKLTPLDLNRAGHPKLGEFIAQAKPNGRVLSLGVVSVHARSLRETDKAYLGVLMNRQTNRFGTVLDDVVKGSPAAMGGLRSGDIITAINNQAFKGYTEMRNTLQKLQPGSSILISYRRDNRSHLTKIELGSRPQQLDPRRVPQKRMDEMQRMGAVPSRVRHNFPNVIQSDMPIQPDETPNNPRDDFSNECGGPVVDLNGKPVGITIARGSRIKTFIIPTDTLVKLLKTQPTQQQYSSQRHNDQTARYSRTKKQKRNEPHSRRKSPPRAIPLEE